MKYQKLSSKMTNDSMQAYTLGYSKSKKTTRGFPKKILFNSMYLYSKVRKRKCKHV